jgi:hypothetical protein
MFAVAECCSSYLIAPFHVWRKKCASYVCLSHLEFATKGLTVLLADVLPFKPFLFVEFAAF